MLADFWTYLVSVVWTWYGLLATGIFTILSLMGSKRAIPTKIAKWLAIVGMFVLASFQAWRAERSRYDHLELRTSDAQSFTLDQEQRMRAILDRGAGMTINFAELSMDPHGQEFARRLQSAFKKSGWGVGSGRGSTVGSGRSLRIISDGTNERAVSLIQTAFDEANLRYRVFRAYTGAPLSVEVGESESEAAPLGLGR